MVVFDWYSVTYICTRWFKYDRDWFGLFTHKSVPVIFEPPCTRCETEEMLLVTVGDTHKHWYWYFVVISSPKGGTFKWQILSWLMQFHSMYVTFISRLYFKMLDLLPLLGWWVLWPVYCTPTVCMCHDQGSILHWLFS